MKYFMLAYKVCMIINRIFGRTLFPFHIFANPELVGDGVGGGKMTIEKLSEILQYIQENTDIIGFTIAEYLPFDEYRLHKMFSKIGLIF